MNKPISIKFSEEETFLLNEVCPIVGKLCELEGKLKEFMERPGTARSKYSDIVEKMIRTYFSCIKIIQAVNEGDGVEVKIIPREKKPLLLMV